MYVEAYETLSHQSKFYNMRCFAMFVTAVCVLFLLRLHLSFTRFLLAVLSRMALTRDDIRLAKITTKPRFENANFKFHQEVIPKGAKMKRIPT